MSAERAREIGLVTEVVPLEQLHDAAAWAANTIAAAPATAVQGTVRALWAANDLNRRDALDMGKVLIKLGTDPKSLYEGQQSFAGGKREKPHLR